MTEKIGSIETGWYEPGLSDRFFADDSKLGRVTRRFCGEQTIDLCRKMRAGKISAFSQEDTEKINNYFFRSSKRIYNFPKAWTPQVFYSVCRDDTISAIRYFGKLVPELAEAFELKEEIAHLSDRPSDLLRYLASPPSDIASTLAFETQRHAIVQYQAGTIKARVLNSGLCNLLFDIQDLLDQKLFEGPTGEGDDFCSESFHDKETNQVVGFPDTGDPRPLTAHLKRRWISVRKIPEIGLVHEQSREKELGPTLVKSWVKALGNGGTIHIDEAVQDSIAMRFVLMDDSIPPEQLADKVVSLIKSEIEYRLESNHPNKIPKIVKEQLDNETGVDHGQSTEKNVDIRWKLWFERVPTPIEMAFYKRETFLNSELEVGTRDPQTGLYKGRGHKLFQIRRGFEGVRVAFPQVVYKKIDDDRLYTAFISQSEQEAYGLRARYRVA